MKAFHILPLWFASALFAEDPGVAVLIQQSDTADARGNSRGALVALKQADKLQPENFGVLLRMSKQYGDLAGQSRRAAEAQAFAEEALAVGERALALDRSSAKAHLNLAICHGRLADFVSNRKKVEYARIIRDEARRALELDPADDYAWHVLGRWNIEIAGLSSVLKAVADYLYGGLPPASDEEAVRCFKRAVELAPQRVIHRAELARTYLRISKPDAAAQEWQNLLGLRAQGPQDEQYQRQAKLALEEFRQQRNSAGRGVAGR